MSAIISNNNWDATGRMPIPVIASFSEKGGVRPIYVRVGQQDLKIISCRSTTPKVYQQHPRFEVQVADGEYLRTLHLVFHSPDFIWTVPKEEIGII